MTVAGGVATERLAAAEEAEGAAAAVEAAALSMPVAAPAGINAADVAEETEEVDDDIDIENGASAAAFRGVGVTDDEEVTPEGRATTGGAPITITPEESINGATGCKPDVGKKFDFL